MGVATGVVAERYEKTPVAAPSGTAPSATTAVLDEEPRLDESIEEQWMSVVEAVNGQKRMLGAFLQESRLVGIAGRSLVLHMDALHRSVVDERDNRALVERHVAERFGMSLTLQCMVAGANLRREAEDLTPLVERAIAWFEGEMISRPRETGRGDA